MKTLIAIILVVWFWGYLWQTERAHEGWRFHIWENGQTVQKDFYYSEVLTDDKTGTTFYDETAYNYHPKNFTTYWKVRGVENWLKVEKIYKKVNKK